MPSVDRIGAIAFSVLLVLSLFTPVVASADSSGNVPSVDTSQDANTEQQSTQDENTTDRASSLQLRLEARDRLRNATIRGGPNANQRLMDRINDSLEHYVGPNRADEVQIFNYDTQVISRTKQTAPKVSNRLLASQARLAQTTMADANRTVSALEERNASFNVRRSHNQLEAAQRQFENGETRRDNDQPNAAIAGYRHAFLRSNRLLERLNQRTDPSIELRSRADPLRIGSANFTVHGSIFAVQPNQLKNLTVSTGNTSKEVQINRTDRPGTQVPFSTTVQLPSQNATIEIGAETQNDQRERTTGTDSIIYRLDGDGLPDWIEATVTHTDPLNPNSNSSFTSEDESQNRIVDGREDFDEDGLYTMVEANEGIDPFSEDTDSDGLGDRYEYKHYGLNPLSSDSNDDGIADAVSDFDGDGLNNAREEDTGTNPTRKDTDDDYLSDREELEKYSTNATNPDTDGDGVKDGVEIRLGTDPNLYDSDGDGVSDRKSTYTASQTVENTSASVSVTGSPDAIESISTRRVPQTNSDDFRRSDVVRIENDSTFDNATVHFDVPIGANDSVRSNLSILTWSPTQDDRWHLIETTVENGTASADVEHFSYFTLVDANRWVNTISVSKEPSADDPVTEEVPIDVSLVLDTSGSMAPPPDGGGIVVNSHNGNTGKIGDARGAANQFLNTLDGEDRVSVIGFDGIATVHQELSSDHNTARSAIEQLHASGGTAIHAGIGAARQQHANRGSDDHRQAIVLLSDGQSERQAAIEQAQAAADDKITIHTVAVGERADESLLRDIADASGGEFLSVSDSSDLGEAFLQISDQVQYQDQDDDGLYDIAEQNGIFIPAGKDIGRTVTTDPTDPDTDGDGLQDGREVSLIDFNQVLPGWVLDRVTDRPEDAWIPTAVADPTKINSDDYGIDDAAELERGSNPFVNESFFVSLEIPTLTNNDGNPDNNRGTPPEREVLYTSSYDWGSRDCLWKICDHERPKWLTKPTSFDNLQWGNRYYKVPAIIRVDAVGVESIPIESVDIHLNEGSHRLVGNVENIDVEEGSNQIDLIFETSGSSGGVDRGTLGKFELQLVYQSDSIFNRDGSGEDEQVTMATERYGYFSMNVDQASQLVDNSMNIWAEATLQAYGVYSLYYGVGTATSSSDIGWAIAEFAGVPDLRSPSNTANWIVRRQIGEAIGNGNYDGDASLRKRDGYIHTHNPQRGQSQSYMYLGPAILREN